MTFTKYYLLLIFCCSLLTLNAAPKTYYVTPDGSASNDGSSFNKPLNFATAITLVVAGDNILLKEGIYSIPYKAGQKSTLLFSKSGAAGKPISIATNNNGRAIFDFSFPPQAWMQDCFGFEITGSYWYFKGISITRAGYQGAYVKGAFNTFENCTFYDNRNTGLEINKGGSNTTVINCDSYKNYDPKKKGSMADGFGPKETQGPGNKFIGCRSWENSDDGYDAFNSAEKVVFEGCWAFRNGVDTWNYGGFSGNGNGLKVGGNFKQANHKLTNCVAFGNPTKGFDQNNNTGGLTIYNCTAYSNGTNFGLINGVNAGQKHDLKNNISLSGPVAITNANEVNNSWNSGFSVSSADFASLDLSLATAPRQADGSLPINNLFRLKSTSTLIDKGATVGLPFSGKAPDLGAFEFASASTTGRVASDLAIILYPNPVEDEINIRFDSAVGASTLSIQSLQEGHVYLRTSVEAGEATVNCRALQPGVYIGVIENNGVVQKFKFIKQ